MDTNATGNYSNLSFDTIYGVAGFILVSQRELGNEEGKNIKMAIANVQQHGGFVRLT